VDSTRIIYTPRLGATPEGEVAALASVYRFLLDCHAKKKGGPATTSDNGTTSIEDSTNAVRK
jgi:hypothetical protein